MLNKSRESEIISLIKSRGDYATVEFLSNALSLSPSTVRRHLQDMEGRGVVKRSYGGVTYAESENGLEPFTLRTQSNYLEKITVCRLASSLVKEGDVIFTDPSSTAYCLTNFLKEFNNITVISNGIETVNSLRLSKVTVYSTGGKVSPSNKVALIGKQAIDFINGVRANVTFISSFGISTKGGVYDVYDEEIAVRQAMMNNSDKNYLLLDHSKLNKTATFKLCSVTDFDKIICDKDITGFFDKNVLPNVYCPE